MREGEDGSMSTNTNGDLGGAGVPPAETGGAGVPPANPWTADVPVGTEQPWSPDDAVIDALLEVAHARQAGSVGSLPTPSPDRHHPKSRPTPSRRLTRESVLLSVGGLVLCAVALVLALGLLNDGGTGDLENEKSAGESKSGVDGSLATDDGNVADRNDESTLNWSSQVETYRDFSTTSNRPKKRTTHIPYTSGTTLEMVGFDGDRLNKSILGLTVSGRQVDDKSLGIIAEKCPELVGLTLYDTDITDEGFAKHIGTFRRLRQLSLSHSRRITDKGISALISITKQEGDTQARESLTLPMLSELDLSGFMGQTSVGPEGLPEGYVDPYSKLTDKSCEYVAAYNLELLYLSGVPITDQGVRLLFSRKGLPHPLFPAYKGPSLYMQLDLEGTKVTADGFPPIADGDTPQREVWYLSLVNSKVKASDLPQLAARLPSVTAWEIGGNGFTPLQLSPSDLLVLKNTGKVHYLALRWVDCGSKADWSPISELTSLSSLVINSMSGDTSNLLLAVAKLSKLSFLELASIRALCPMTRKPMDASEYVEDHPVVGLRTLPVLQYLNLRGSSHISESALFFIKASHAAYHPQQAKELTLIAPDGTEVLIPIAKIAVSAGRANHEGGAAVALLDKSGVVASIGRQRQMRFNDGLSIFPKEFKLTSGVRPTVELYQPCYDASGVQSFREYRVVAMLPSSPAGWKDDKMQRYLTYSTRFPPDAASARAADMSQILVTLPAYDMKRWPKKEIWGTRTPDFAVRINDSKTKGIAAAIAISTGPIEDWIFKGPGSQAPDGAHKAGAVMAVIKPTPDPQGDEGQSWHYADVEIPQGTHWLIVMAPGHKPYQREFAYDGKPIDLVIDMDEVAKPAPAKSE